MAAQPVAVQPAEPQPQAERQQGERHRQRKIDEAEQERKAIGKGQAKSAVGGRRWWTSRATHSMPATVIGGMP